MAGGLLLEQPAQHLPRSLPRCPLAQDQILHHALEYGGDGGDDDDNDDYILNQAQILHHALEYGGDGDEHDNDDDGVG